MGNACCTGSLDPKEGLVAFSELRKARKQFVLDHEFHLIYIITPIFHGLFEPSWPKYVYS